MNRKPVLPVPTYETISIKNLFFFRDNIRTSIQLLSLFIFFNIFFFLKNSSIVFIIDTRNPQKQCLYVLSLQRSPSFLSKWNYQ